MNSLNELGLTEIDAISTFSERYMYVVCTRQSELEQRNAVHAL